MSRIVITGVAGFLGSRLAEALIAQGHEVSGIDNLRRGTIDAIRRHIDSGRLRFLQGDIRDEDDVRSALAGAEIVFHLAAQSNVLGAITDPDYSFFTNVMGTYRVLKAASQAGVRQLVFTSSREVYGEPRSLPADESQATQPKNFYGASKVAGEAYCRAFDGRDGLACTVLRLGNIYGPGDRDRVIPLWLDAAMAGRDLVIYGDDKVLDFLHVGYAVQALIAASQCGDYGPINVASGTGTNLRDLATQILALTDSKSSLVIEPTRPVEVTRFVANVDRMRTLLHLEPPGDSLAGLASLIPAAVAFVGETAGKPQTGSLRRAAAA